MQLFLHLLHLIKTLSSDSKDIAPKAIDSYYMVVGGYELHSPRLKMMILSMKLKVHQYCHHWISVSFAWPAEKKRPIDDDDSAY